MIIAVNSEDGIHISGKSGRARRFTIFVAAARREPARFGTLQIDERFADLHTLHDDDSTPHPLDGMVLITAEAGHGFTRRLARRGIKVCVTSESSADRAVIQYLRNSLPLLPESPHDEGHCSA